MLIRFARFAVFLLHLFLHLVTLQMHDPKMTDKQNYGVWKMQDGKMTDKLLANCEHNYGVWKMQEYKSI